MSCAESFDRVGMPEGRYPLAQATLYLATAPKSNSAMAFFDALSAVETEQQRDVPNPLRDPNRDKEGFGHGKGYLYPHSYREHWVAQQYLPSGLQGQIFYQPSDQGYEQSIQQQVMRRREAQLAAMVEGTSTPTSEALTYSPDDPARDRWLQRTISQTGERLGQVRDHLFATLDIQRHHTILDLNARSGLLTWEAVRQVPEGGVYSRVETAQDLAALKEQAAMLPALARPVIFQTSLSELPQGLSQNAPDIQFDRIVGRNVFGAIAPTVNLLESIVAALNMTGRLALAETVPRESQRLWKLIPAEKLPGQLQEHWRQAEEALYADTADPRLAWTGASLVDLLETTRLAVTWSQEVVQSDLFVSSKLCDRWFDTANPNSYRSRLATVISTQDLATIEKLLRQQVQNQTVPWQSTYLWLTGELIAAA